MYTYINTYELSCSYVDWRATCSYVTRYVHMWIENEWASGSSYPHMSKWPVISTYEQVARQVARHIWMSKWLVTSTYTSHLTSHLLICGSSYPDMTKWLVKWLVYVDVMSHVLIHIWRAKWPATIYDEPLDEPLAHSFSMCIIYDESHIWRAM